MTSIVLVRHGQPDVEWSPGLTFSQFRKWTANYDTVPLIDDSFPDSDLVAVAGNPSTVFCSTLRRSQQSHLRSGCQQDFVANAIFDEVKLTVPPIPVIRMKPVGWVLLSMRLLRWGVGRKAVTKRADQAAELLIRTSLQNGGCTLLFGHGTMNGYIHEGLLARAWNCERQSAEPGAYWSWRSYCPS